MAYDNNDKKSEYGDKRLLPLDVTLRSLVDMENVATILSDEDLASIGAEVVKGYETDLESRKPWFDRYEAAMKLAMQVYEVKTYPWRNASNVKFPLITLASLQFHARAYPGLIPSKGVVMGKAIGRDFFGIKRRRAERVAIHMNYQVLDQMEEWEEDMDRLLITLPITGVEFKKTYYSGALERPISKHVFAKDLVVDYYAKNLDSAARITEVLSLYPNEIREAQLAGTFIDCELHSDPSAAREDKATQTSDKVQLAQKPSVEVSADTAREVLEQHTWYDLDGDGYKEPYICVVDRKLSKVLRIVARFKKDGVSLSRGKVLKVVPERYYTKFEFIPSPDGGFYGIGFGSLIYPINESVNAIINQLIDAGTLDNLQSGWISKQFKTRSGDAPFAPGEWRTVNAQAGDLKNGIVPLPTKSPSTVLFSLLGLLIDVAQRITSTTDMLVGENPGQNQKATTTMAVVENGMRVFTAIYKRNRRALTQEMKLIYGINRTYLDDTEYVTIVDPSADELREMSISKGDYNDDSIDIVPTADPNATSQFNKVMQAEAIMKMVSLGTDRRAAAKRYYEAYEVENYEELLPPMNSEVPPAPEVMQKEKEIELKARKQALDEYLGMRESERKDFEARIKAQDSLNKAHIDNKKIDTDASVRSMEVVLNDNSNRRKVESDERRTSSGEQDE